MELSKSSPYTHVMNFSRKPLVALTLLLTLLGSIGAVAVGPTNASPSDNAQGFWTEARLKSAIARDFQFEPGATVGKIVATGKATSTAGKPSTGGNIGSSWNNKGLPLAATGKVYFTVGASAYVCSGSVVADSDSARSIVLTAGHCVYDNATQAYVTNFIFIPAFDTYPTYTCANTAYGCWSARKLVASSGFTTQTAFTTTATNNDWGFAVMTTGGKSGSSQLDATVGSFPISTSALVKGWTSYAFGYPAASPYNGSDLVYCNGATNTDPNSGNTTWKLACNMTGGASGGPWMNSFNTNNFTGVLSSVNSYKYTNDANSMYGPMFNSNTQAALTSALTWPLA